MHSVIFWHSIKKSYDPKDTLDHFVHCERRLNFPASVVDWLRRGACQTLDTKKGNKNA